MYNNLLSYPLNIFIKLNSHNLKRWDAWYFRDVPEILKEREGDNLGDGKFSGFQEMGISLNEVFPFLSI